MTNLTNLTFGRKPWLLTDHLSNPIYEDIAIRDNLNHKAFYLGFHSSVQDLIGYRSQGADPISAAVHPQGWWFKSITLKNCIVDGVRATNGNHVDAIYVYNTAPEPVDLTLENIHVSNTDGSTMTVLLQPGKYGTVTLKDLFVDGNCVQKRVVFKPGVHIECLRIIGGSYYSVAYDTPGYAFDVKTINIYGSQDITYFRGQTNVVNAVIDAPQPPPVVVPLASVEQILQDALNKIRSMQV